MEEIKVYHSFKRNAFLLIASAALTFLMGISLIKDNAPLGGWFCTILFGGSCLFLCFWFLSERLTGKAYLIITDKSLRINTFKGREVQFSDVASFAYEGNMICINYKNGKGPDNRTQIFKRYFIDFGDGFMAKGLTLKPEDICTILNNRLEATSTNNE